VGLVQFLGQNLKQSLASMPTSVSTALRAPSAPTRNEAQISDISPLSIDQAYYAGWRP
jgi:hypothetical protein